MSAIQLLSRSELHEVSCGINFKYRSKIILYEWSKKGEALMECDWDIVRFERTMSAISQNLLINKNGDGSDKCLVKSEVFLSKASPKEKTQHVESLIRQKNKKWEKRISLLKGQNKFGLNRGKTDVMYYEYLRPCKTIFSETSLEKGFCFTCK